MTARVGPREVASDVLAAGAAAYSITEWVIGGAIGLLIVGAVFAVLASLDAVRALRAHR